MKLIDAIKEKGNPFWIPDCVRAELPEFFLQLGFKRGAEIGVSHAENLANYCKAGLEMFGIDPWIDYEDDPFKRIISVSGKYGRSIEGVYQLAQERTAKYPNCTLIRKTSMDALADFPDRSLDFVYIDGNHKFGYVAMDLWKWSRKVRKHGIIAGHDYYTVEEGRWRREHRGVPLVVDAFVKHSDINNWYIIGRKNEVREEGERVDPALSFFFFKHW